MKKKGKVFMEAFGEPKQNTVPKNKQIGRAGPHRYFEQSPKSRKKKRFVVSGLGCLGILDFEF